ncbi:MAG TPA: [protein-PII] uridylyltransferase, partial [Micromonosporaceae bacterium]
MTVSKGGTTSPTDPADVHTLLTRPGPGGVGAAARATRAAALDAWLGSVIAAADGAAGAGFALIALGSLGRREPAPHADLDLVLLHNGRTDIRAVAERIWYPIWDAGLSLDHSVRTLDEALAVATSDTKAGLGLLDARHLAGDARLTSQLRDLTSQRWRQQARSHLPMLRELTTQRWRQQGELAFLLDGDIKEARGGLRDVRVLRGVGYAQVADAWRPPVRAAYHRLLDLRDCLHLVARRRRDRVFGEELADVARLLDLGSPDALRRRIADDARTVSYAVDDALRAAERWLAVQRRGGGRSAAAVRSPIAPDVVAQDGEAVLARAAVSPTVDSTLGLRVAAAAARHGLRISPGTLDWLARRCPPPPRPWPDAGRAAFIQLLGCGPVLVSTWEACDRFGLITSWLPEWARVRSAPQHNPVHRFTVDRHLIECVAVAGRYTREVTRPDLLLLGALLHDIGKGLPGDHSVVGVELASGIASAMGFPPRDVQVIERLVRWHLLLPDVATRRDLDDPRTIEHVARTVGEEETLDLLHALSRADALATGPAAWSAWKERLVADLVERVRATLVTGTVPPAPPVEHLAAPLAAGPLPAVEITPDRVVVAATDRLGLLASIAGCLALHRLDVISADTATITTEGGPVAVISCRVQSRDVAGADRKRLAADLSRAVSGELRVGEALAARARRTGRSGAGSSGTGRSGAGRGGLFAAGAAAAVAPPKVVWSLDGATDATILELRAADEAGLLYRVAEALHRSGANVRSARI